MTEIFLAGVPLPLWPLLAFAFSFIGALIIGYNQWAKLDGRHLTLWRYPGVLLGSLFVMPFVDLPGDGMFYISAAGMGLVLAGSDILLSNAARDHGGRLTALYIPMKVILVFAAWLALDGAQRAGLLAEPAVLAGVVLCLAGSALALNTLRRSDASWPALRAVVPVAVLLGVADIVAKILLDQPGSDVRAMAGGAVGWMLVTGLVAAGFSYIVMVRAPHKKRVKVGMPMADIVKAGLFGLLLLGGITVLLTALALAPNPGYVGAITMLSAVWLSIWGYVRNGERTSLLAGIVLVLSALVLALLTA